MPRRSLVNGVKTKPPRLNEQLIQSITNAIRLGCYIETAAAQAGVSRQAFHEWLRKGRNETGKITGNIYGKLLYAIEKAQAEAETRDLLNIDRTASGIKSEPLLEPAMQVARNQNGDEVFDAYGKPVLVVARDHNGQVIMKQVYDSRGNPVMKVEGVKADWRASAWKMERRFSSRWGQRNSLEVNNPDGNLKAAPAVIVLPSNGREGSNGGEQD
jgi:hypothetical protein